MGVSRLAKLFWHCLHQRRKHTEFIELLKCATKKWKSSEFEVAACLVASALNFCPPNDPLIPRYLQAILLAGETKPSLVLIICMQRWQRDGGKDHTIEAEKAKVLAQLLTDLTMILTTLQLSTREARTCLVLDARWLEALFDLADHDEPKPTSEQNVVLIGATNLFLITTMNTVGGLRAIKVVENKRQDSLNVAVRKVIQRSMDISPDISMQLIAEAEKHPALLDATDNVSGNMHDTEMAAMEFEAGIANAPLLPSTNATYLFLYTKLVTGSTIDDAAVCQFMNTRYAGNNIAMLNDLLVSCFETLTKAPQPQQSFYRTQCQIFICNKLPTILSIINAFAPVPTDACLQQLWHHLSSMQDTETLSLAKHFLHICVLHHLIPAAMVQSLTGEDSGSTSAKGLYVKEALVNQVNDNPLRGPRLVEELTKNDGSAGAISHAVVEVMHRFCQGRETQHLKDMSLAIVRSPSTINSLGMFLKPQFILMPVCRLLDEWSWDIHGESQPIYEEFGSILLLVSVFKHKLHLKNTELGITNYNGFVARYLTSGYVGKSREALTKDDNDKLGEWIDNLYYSEGISDDVTTNCSAKDFYLLLPNLLRLSMTAFSKGALPQDKLEGGLDYLLEPFLLPSLLPTLFWLHDVAHQDVKAATTILQHLVKSPENADTSKVHHTILDLAYDAAWKLKGLPADRAVDSELLALFGTRDTVCVNIRPTEDELVSWKNQEGGLLGLLQRGLMDLVSIQSQGVLQPGLLAMVVVSCTAKKVAHEMVSLLVQFASSQDFAQLLDILATVIATATTGPISLRTALELLHTDVGTDVKNGDTLFAEALVHLHRQVQAYVTALTPQPGAMDPALLSMDGVDLAEINLDQISTEVEQPKAPLQTSQPDNLLPDNIDSIFTQTGDLENLDGFTGNEDNIFGMDDYELQDLGDLDMSMF